MTTTEVKAGYKKTKLGWIPTTWGVVRINDFSNIDKDSLKSSCDPDFEFSYISLSDVNNGSVNVDLDIYQFRDAPSRARRIVFKQDVLLATVRPNLKSFAFVSKLNGPTIASTGFAVISCKEDLDPRFLFHNLFSRASSAQFYSLVVGSNYPAINSSDVKKFKIPLPPLPEQKKIADILSTWDKAIETTQALIKKLQLRKKGLMQQLLTGKKRLPGFSGEWKFIKASELFANHTDKSHNGEFEVLSATQDKGVIPRSQTGIDIKYDKSSLKNYKKIDEGEFVISLRSFQGGIEYSRYLGLVSPAYTVLKEKQQIDKVFYIDYFKTDTFIQRLNSIIYGIRDGKQISYRDFSSLKLHYPPVEEQIAIGGLITKADEEIHQTQKYLDQLQEQKKGLMQQLLTGQKRVVV